MSFAISRPSNSALSLFVKLPFCALRESARYRACSRDVKSSLRMCLGRFGDISPELSTRCKGEEPRLAICLSITEPLTCIYSGFVVLKRCSYSAILSRGAAKEFSPRRKPLGLDDSCQQPRRGVTKTDRLLSPVPGLYYASILSRRLAPWAKFCRRSAACGLRAIALPHWRIDLTPATP